MHVSGLLVPDKAPKAQNDNTHPPVYALKTPVGVDKEPHAATGKTKKEKRQKKKLFFRKFLQATHPSTYQSSVPKPRCVLVTKGKAAETSPGRTFSNRITKMDQNTQQRKTVPTASAQQVSRPTAIVSRAAASSRASQGPRQTL